MARKNIDDESYEYLSKNFSGSYHNPVDWRKIVNILKAYLSEKHSMDRARELVKQVPAMQANAVLAEERAQRIDELQKKIEFLNAEVKSKDEVIKKMREAMGV